MIYKLVKYKYNHIQDTTGTLGCSLSLSPNVTLIYTYGNNDYD